MQAMILLQQSRRRPQKLSYPMSKLSNTTGDSPDGEVDVDHHGSPSVGPHAAVVAGLEQEIVQCLRGLLAQAGAAAVERPESRHQ